MPPDEERPRQRRRSITKRQQETSWGAELLALCQTVTEDGRLLEAEVHELRHWLEANADVDLPAKDVLLLTVREILADGRVTPAERSELHRIIESVLPPDLRDLARLRRRSADEEHREDRKRRRVEQKEQSSADREARRPIMVLDFMVAGISHDRRADVIERYAESGDPVFLVRDPANQYSRNAIEIRLTNGMQIGYVPEEFAIDAAPHLDAGAKQITHIKKILGTSRGPLPVVVAQIHSPDTNLPGAIAATEIPAKTSPPPDLVTSDPRLAAERLRTHPATKDRAGCAPVILLVVLVLLSVISSLHA